MDCLLNLTLIVCASADIPKPVVPISSPQSSMIANLYFLTGDWVAFSSQKCNGLMIRVL
ncbi:Secreted protein [Pseudomonas sp. IT-P100]